jgi:hypothetical protein
MSIYLKTSGKSSVKKPVKPSIKGKSSVCYESKPLKTQKDSTSSPPETMSKNPAIKFILWQYPTSLLAIE